MSKYCKLLIVFALLLVGEKGFSANTVLHTTTCSISINASSIDKQANEGFPSHGYAMLILRYNDDSKDKIFSLLLSNPGAPCIATLKPVFDNSKTYSSYSPYFPEKKLRYEAFLYSLPLRSPPATC